MNVMSVWMQICVSVFNLFDLCIFGFLNLVKRYFLAVVYVVINGKKISVKSFELPVLSWVYRVLQPTLPYRVNMIRKGEIEESYQYCR